MVPCPHTARHIVVSHATVKATFGHSFTDEYEDATKMRVQRQHKIFALARTGYEALFKMRTDDAKYVVDRTAELYGDIKTHGGLSIAMHVRHGDKHPLEYQYNKDYIPLDRYVNTARDLYIDIIENGNTKSKSKAKSRSQSLETRHTASRMILASDDPLVYASPELGASALRAQDRIVLATKAALEAASNPRTRKSPWLDDITGWEGGFYRDIFFSLGQPSGNAIAQTQPQGVSEQAMRLRELVGRAYLLDVAVLGAADSVVCTVSSATCRVLAVVMGWEKAVGKERWRNVDGEWEWRGIMW